MSKQPDTPPKSPLQIALEPLDVRDVSRSLYGVPLKTVYRWRDGTRVPPAWLQSLILAALGPIRLEYEQKKKLTDGEMRNNHPSGTNTAPRRAAPGIKTQIRQ